MQHALVTGSSSGIGHAIATALLDAGWQVTGLDRADATIAHAAYVHRAVDLTDSAASRTTAQACATVDAFVHAAGVLRVGKVGELDHAGGELMWKLHVDAAARVADVLIPAMAARGNGRVVLIGSRVAAGKAGRGQYAATKAALIALAKSWAAEVAAQGPARKRQVLHIKRPVEPQPRPQLRDILRRRTLAQHRARLGGPRQDHPARRHAPPSPCGEAMGPNSVGLR